MNVTRKVLDALRRDHYPPPRYVWAEEVPIPGGRRVDAACIDTSLDWCPVTGFEVKVSRSDWRNDRDGEKSLDARLFFDAFYFVFGSPTIFDVREVPPATGVIVIVDGVAEVLRPSSGEASLDAIPARAPLRAVLRATSEHRDALFLRAAEARAFAQGEAIGYNAARRRDRSGRRHSDHAKPILDDGVELDLP